MCAGPLGALLVSVKGHSRMRSCERDGSQGNWAI
jgi:hypothetical protein